jgi:hypothetical protein
LILPRLEPEPERPVAAVAKVEWIDDISVLGLSRTPQRDLALSHPYQIVRLRFLPPGKTSPVTAVDKIDKGSIPNLQQGQVVPIVYDERDPRIVRLQQGTRLFPGQARNEALLAIGGIFMALLITLLAGRWLVRRLLANSLARRQR